MNVNAANDSVAVSLTYDTGKLMDYIAESLGRTFSTIISNIISSPDAGVCELNLLSPSDWTRLLAWNSPLATAVKEAVQERVQSMCLVTPERPAIDAWDGCLTYSELWDHTLHLAGMLQSHGVTIETPVPICLEKSVWVPVCMLAVLLAGGVCVPMDPEAHIERVQAIIEETSPSVIIVSPTSALLDFRVPCQRIVISSDLFVASEPEDKATSLVQVDPENAAFLLFTSGSTGRPKGIVLQHDSISTTLRDQRSNLLLNSDSRVLHFASYTFDVSVYEVLATLTAGACVCIPSEAVRVNDLAGFIREKQVNWVISTPSLFRLFQPVDIPSVRTVSLAGEAIPQDMVDVWAGQVQLFNAYGPAECTICTTHRIEPQDWIPGTIGRAAGGEAWVTDRSNSDRLLPIGAVGELLFQGPVVAREYFKRPDATQQAFLTALPSWLSASLPEGRGRLYRTGDLVQYNPDGALRYLGRKDTQVKLRGQRIELEAIESQIRGHLPPDYRVLVDAVPPADQASTKLLIAFIQQKRGSDQTESELLTADESFRTLALEIQAKITASMPNYMVPQLLIPVTHIPVSKTGKTNRRVLHEAASELSRGDLESLFNGGVEDRPQPTTPAEEAMQRLWATVLDRPAQILGIRDNFFQIGGDSITAMKLVGLVRGQGQALAVSDVFNRPTLAGLAAGLESAGSLDKALPYLPYSLVRPDDDRVETLRASALASCGVAPDALMDLYPCTALQEGLMSLTIKQQGSYVAQYQYELGCGVDAQQMAAAWDLVVAANPILRTRIIQSSSGRLFQVVLGHGDTCHLETSGVKELKRSAKEQNIGLGTPLLQYFVAFEGTAAHLVLTIHHALYDGWSMTLLLEQLESAYEGLQPKMRSYTGFIDYIDHVDPVACKQFWQAYFEHTDRATFPTPPAHEDHGNSDSMNLELVEQRLEMPAVRSRFTLSATVRLAWALVLSKHTDNPDVVFGATVAGRSAPVDGIEEMTGPTIATVPLRIQIDPAATVERCLEDVQRQTIAMIPYEGTGLHHIRDSSSEAAAACEFQNLLVIQQQGSFYQPKLLREVHRSTDNIAAINTYPLTLLCNLNGDHILTQASFDPKVLSAVMVRLLVSQLESAILQLLGPLATSITNVSLDGEEALREVQSWNRYVPPVVEATVHGLMESHFRNQPEAPAVHSWDGDLSYGDLDRLSAQLARDLVQKGVGPEVLVPVYLEKCKWAPVAILAVLRAGGAFVLLDPAHPPDRLKSIYVQLDAPVLLSISALATTAQSLAPDVFYLDKKEWDAAHDGAPMTDPSGTVPRNMLYVVFTSGTTGVPKGVIIEHGAFLSTVFAVQDGLGLSPSTRALQATAFAFDVCVFDHLATLLVGGCLCIPRTSQLQGDLAGAIHELGANYTIITPSMADLLRPEDVPGLRTLALAGEPTTAGLVANWAERVRLVNAYGPAECSVLCTLLAPVRRQDRYANIGRATGSASWVVDPADPDKLAPLGTVGELWVEGPILARGYLHDEAKTRTSFVLDPVWARQLPPAPGPRRFYRTGDLVRYQPEDGALLYVGRKDTQVKVRGQRIELGEVEYRVKNLLPEVARLAVDVFTPAGEDSEPILAAFIQMMPESSGVEDESSRGALFAPATETFGARVQAILDPLRKQLTASMVPAVFFPVLRIPLSATGKADRRKLKQAASRLGPSEVRHYMLAEKSKRPPASANERLVQSICGRVLKMEVEDIGMHDSFLQLGGHSISAIQFVGQARAAGWAVELAHVLSEATLAGLAAKLRPGENKAAVPRIVPFSLLREPDHEASMRSRAADACSVAVDQIEDIYPATALQAGLLALSLKRPGSYQALIRLRLAPHGDLSRLRRAWEKTVEANEILRTRLFQGIDGELYQAVVNTSVQWHSATNSDGAIPTEARLPVALGATLTRATVIQSPGETHCSLVLTLHHALYDGWSLPILFKDLQSAYRSHTLVSRPFNGFVDYLRHVKSEATADYWRSELQGLECPPFPGLPSVQYTPIATESLEHTLNYHGANPRFTASMILRLAWAVTISSYTGLEDVVFGTTVAGRSAPVPGIGAMTGPTIATVPFRVRLDPGQPTSDALAALRTRATEMIRFEQAGLQQIRTWGPDAAAACQFQSLLVIQWMEPGDSDDAEAADFFVDAESANDDTAFSSYAINITCELYASSITLRVAYDGTVTQPGVMRMMLFQMAHAASRILENCPLVRDAMTISPEGLESVSRWNTIPPSEPACVHDMILSHSERTPDAVAVKAWDGELTYRQLDALSLGVATSLASQVLEPEPIVPLLFEKSMWTAVALVGTLRAGGAFLLLDPAQPTARLRSLCEAVGAEVVLASEKQAALAANLAPAKATVQVCSETTLREGADFKTALARLPASDHRRLLYCVFTSGSTGTPKGVLIEHGSFCTSIAGVCRVLPFGPSTRVFQFASYAFDVGITDHLVPLMVGGSIYVPHPADVRDNLAACLRKSRATYLELVPSVARTLDMDTAASLEVLALSGEAKTAADVERWKGRLVSGYGPAECSAASNIQFPVTAEDHPQALGVSTGGAGWVVDPTDVERLVPIGAVGELIIEGPIVGRGYLKDPERTAAAFIPPMRWLQQLRGGAPTRVYRTGDLVQLLSTGDLRFVGREDHQVKVRGQRIELGEVENHLHPLFRGTTNVVAEVLKPGEREDQAYLTAFVDCPGLSGQPDGNAAEMTLLPPSATFLAEVHEAERHLRDTVPAYMIPALFLPVNHFALSSSDKVDRKALRALGNSRSWKDLQMYTHSRGPRRAPETETQETLLLLCAKVLNLDPQEIGIDDGFLSLGGDSISAMSLVAHANAQQRIVLTVADVLSQPSLEKLAARARRDETLLPASSHPAERPDVSFALAPIQKIFFESMTPECLNHYNQSFFMALSRTVALDDMQSAVRTLLKRHSMLRSRFVQSDGEWIQTIVSAQSEFIFTASSVPDFEALDPLVLETQQRLDIGKGLLFGVHLFDVEHHGQHMLLVAHHLVVDHVSWRVILADLEYLLDSESLPGAAHLTTTPLSFQTWCHLQSQFVRESLPAPSTFPELGDHQGSLSPSFLDYWGLVDAVNTNADAISTSFTLSQTATHSLLTDANGAFQTRPVEILQAALIFSFMQEFPDRAPPVVHNEGHGREVWDASIDLSRTVGWFTTIWPSPAAVQSRHSLIEVIKRTKDGRRQMSRNGWDYFAAKLLHPEGPKRMALPLEIVLNFAGSFQELEDEKGLFRLHEHQYTRFDAATQAPRSELFEVSAIVKKGRLQVDISYHRQMPSDRIERWSSDFQAALEGASLTLPSTPKQPTLADFPLLEINYLGLDRMVEQVAAVLGSGAEVAIEDAFACTGIQQGMLLSQAKNESHYVTGTTWQLQAPGGLDRDRFLRAWHEVVEHNPALRTVFLEGHSGQVWDQLVLRRTAGKVVVKDAQGPISQTDDVGSITPTCPWHLVLRPQGDGLVCDFQILHALVDGISVGLLQQQIAAVYDGKPLPPRTASLKEYVAYVQGLPQGSATRYWADYLAGTEPCMLPTAEGDTRGEHNGGVKYVFRSLSDIAGLRAFCDRHGVTMFNLVQLAWGLVLKAYTGAETPCFGYLVTGRNVPVADVDQIIGPFINMVVCKIELDGNRSIEETARSVHSDFLQGLSHQHTSLAEVFHELRVSGRGLFNTVVSLQTKTEGEGAQDDPLGLSMLPMTGDDPTEVSLNSIRVEVLGQAH